MKPVEHNSPQLKVYPWYNIWKSDQESLGSNPTLVETSTFLFRPIHLIRRGISDKLDYQKEDSVDTVHSTAKLHSMLSQQIDFQLCVGTFLCHLFIAICGISQPANLCVYHSSLVSLKFLNL